ITSVELMKIRARAAEILSHVNSEVRHVVELGGEIQESRPRFDELRKPGGRDVASMNEPVAPDPEAIRGKIPLDQRVDVKAGIKDVTRSVAETVLRIQRKGRFHRRDHRVHVAPCPMAESIQPMITRLLFATMVSRCVLRSATLEIPIVSGRLVGQKDPGIRLE